MPPTIDTSIARAMYSTSSTVGGSYVRPLAIPQESRARSLSTASTSSSISVATPDPSSGNPSSSSLHLPPSSGTISERTTMASSSTLVQDDLSPDPYESRQFSPEPLDEFVLALHDYISQQQNATCLSFRAGDKIRVLNRDPSGWWDGELDGRRGWFPSNYVNKTVTSLLDEELPKPRRHGHSKSDGSLLSHISSSGPDLGSAFITSHENTVPNTYYSSDNKHCPSIMTPLLHGLQLLQNTTAARRVTHYQPSVACVIQCIRSILQATECLPRESPVLERFPVLAQERKRVLSELALLVTQAKKASAHYTNEEEREVDEDIMLKLAGQVFARVRRFLALAVQCGVDLPERRFNQAEMTGENVNMRSDHEEGERHQYGFQVLPNADDEEFYPVASVRNPMNDVHIRRSLEDERPLSSLSNNRLSSAQEVTVIPRTSLEDGPSSADSSAPLIRSGNILVGRSRAEPYGKTSSQSNAIHRSYRSSQMSISSQSSVSDSSSLNSPGTPSTPAFPEGPSSTSAVLAATHLCHDNLLSTIAAFIGHVHSYSRTAHASSTGHLYDLVRQIVDIVCRVLTIVEAVVAVPSLPESRALSLENAKENLYQIACFLADSVRDMTSGRSQKASEEAEQSDLIRLATDALKAGTDCCNGVKSWLTRPSTTSVVIINLPSSRDIPSQSSDSSRLRSGTEQGIRLTEAIVDDPVARQELSYVHDTPYEEQDVDDTIRPNSAMQKSSPFPHGETARPVSALAHPMSEHPSRRESHSEPTEEDEDQYPNVEIRMAYGENALPSPVSEVPVDAATDCDATTWEGSQRTHTFHVLEDKLIRGDLPTLPGTDEGIPLSWALSHDYAPQDVAYNSEGHLVGATMEALVEKMTPHDSIVDPAFAAIFFLTFRLFSTPVELAHIMVDRFNIEQPIGLHEDDLDVWKHRKQLPVRLRVSNFLKLWLETYWRSGTDEPALPILLEFVRNVMSDVFANNAQRLEDLIGNRLLAAQPNSPVSERSERFRFGERLRDAGMPINPPFISPSEIPRPVMTKTLFSNLRNKNFSAITITDFDALELARQMTIMECNLYCSITAEEILEMGQPSAPPAVNVKAVSSLSTAITGWVAESILDEPDIKKRTLLVKFFIKVADRCTTLNNFSTPRSILAALDSSTISRLHQTWMGLAQKSRVQLESLRKLADHARNYHGYRSRLRNTSPPAVPFLGLYLTDLTFCREGNPSHRASPLAPDKRLLNFNKYHKLARIVQDMQRFQVSYNLKDIPEVQEYLRVCFDKAKDHGDLEDLYRRSQLLEPKQPAEAQSSTSELRALFGWGNRSQSSHASQATVA